MNKIIVVSSHSKNVFLHSRYRAVNEQTKEEFDYGLQVPIDVVNYPVKKFSNLPEVPLALDYDFNFLMVSQYGPRKNVANTIKWFVAEFKDEEVGLVVKTNMAKNCHIDFLQMTAKLKSVLADINDDPTQRKCKVYLLHGDMTDEEIHSLYLHPQIKALVSLAHGEGFGLPLFEAAYSGMPVITVGWSGQLDFLVDTDQKERFYNVSFDINNVQKEAVWEGIIQADSKWAYAREGAAKKQLRKCYEDIQSGSEINDRASEYAIDLAERFSAENMYAEFIKSVTSVLDVKAEEAKVIVL